MISVDSNGDIMFHTRQACFYLFLIFIVGMSFDKIEAKSSAHCPYASDSIYEVFKPLPVDYLYHLYDQHPETHEVLDSYFRVKQKLNYKKEKKVLTYSLFWKPQDNVNYETIHQKRWMKGKQTSFYAIYVNPLKKNISYFKKKEPQTRIRIYLAADLEFLVQDLSSSNVEIFLMESSSVGHSPGAMWRFLAFSDPEARWVCCQDSDQIENADDIDLINKWLGDKHTYGFYRMHATKYQEDLGSAIYSPIVANAFGAKKGHGIDFEKAMKGFLLHRELYPEEPRHPRDIAYTDHPYGFGNHFPVYGLDERFLKHVVYYYLADRALLTTLVTSKKKQKLLYEIAKGDKSYLMAKDYFYVLKQNRNAIYR